MGRCWGRGADHLVGDAVGFLLVGITHRADLQFSLDQAGDGAVAGGALQVKDITRLGADGIGDGALEQDRVGRLDLNPRALCSRLGRLPLTRLLV